MLEIIAQGPSIDSRWRRPLVEHTIEIGRTTPAYRVPWDNQISRRHVRMTPEDNQVRVEKLEGASNPVFFDGREEDDFTLRPGETFVIGKTTFTLAADRAFVSLDVPDPISQKTYSPEFLRRVTYQDADRRIDVLNRIPEVISSAGNVEDLLIRMVNTLMAGIIQASTIGIVRLTDDAREAEPSNQNQSLQTMDSIEIVQWDRRGLDEGDFQPSESLIRQAIERDESILYTWNQSKRSAPEYTFDYENDWAFVCPISGDASPGWGIYVAGTNRGNNSSDSNLGEEDLQGDIKFCELVGSTLKNLLLVKQLERQQSSLRTFFSPVVMEALAGRDPEEVLSPRKCDVSVLFCDLRGFSQTSERMADKLLELLARVSDALGIMTRSILDHGGVIGDFHGDSAMGFWGWPLEPPANTINTVSAISAALEIQEEVKSTFRTNPNLQNFQIGVGIASGNAVAGKIGTRDQVKVTVFGPVVNLAARLEGMTRWLDAPILVEGESIRRLENQTGAMGQMATIRLGKYQPFGMNRALDVFQVTSKSGLDASQNETFAIALSCFEEGDWPLARTKLEQLPEEYPAKRSILDFIHRNISPPRGWMGVIEMHAK